VGAAGDLGKEPGDSWHGQIEAAMIARGAQALVTPAGEGLRLQTGDWTPLGKATETDAVSPAPLPAWIKARVAPPPKAATRIAPSGLSGAKALPGETGIDSDLAMRRGTAIHALLEHLPRLDRTDWDARAPAILATHAEVDGADIAPLLAEARAVLEAPALAHVFADGTLAEVPFALPESQTLPAIFGTMDRVIVTPDRVTIIDYKTNAVLPATPAATPEGLLRQMAAYRMAAQAIWPDRAVEVQILWTKGPTLMGIPQDLVTDLGPAIDPVVLPA